MTCPVCGKGPEPGDTQHWHEDDRHRFEYTGGAGHTRAKPPYRIGDLIHAGYIEAGTIQASQVTDSDFARSMEYWEQQRRAMFRQIADAQAVRGEWHEGTCSGCGLEDEPVIGLPGSELCEYCEELRQLVPVDQEPAVTTPAAPVKRHPDRLTTGLRWTLAAFAVMVTGFFVGGEWMTQLSLILFAFGFYNAMRA